MNKHYLKNKESYKKYYQKNKEEIRKKQKLYNDSHKEELKKYFKEYHQKNRVKKCELALQWYDKHREVIKAKYQKNKKKINTDRNNYFIKKRKENIHFRILCNLRIRIWKVLKGINKSKSTLKLLDCSIEQLKHHLEAQFKNGMAWSNYGKWEIDHIRPCASFDLSKEEEQKKCFHYSNLQPLWELENIQKSDNAVIDPNEHP